MSSNRIFHKLPLDFSTIGNIVTPMSLDIPHPSVTYLKRTDVCGLELHSLMRHKDHQLLRTKQ